MVEAAEEISARQEMVLRSETPLAPRPGLYVSAAAVGPQKRAGNGKDAAGTSGERRQMGVRDSTKVQAAKRRRRNLNEERGKITEVHFAKWISVKHR